MALDDKPDPEWLWPNGVMVNQTEDEFIWVVRQIINWRVMTVPKADQSMYKRWWCYEGIGYATLAIAVYAAMVWDGKSDPLAWSKNGQTGVWRDREDALLDLKEIQTMDPVTMTRFHGFIDEGLGQGIILPL